MRINILLGFSFVLLLFLWGVAFGIGWKGVRDSGIHFPFGNMCIAVGSEDNHERHVIENCAIHQKEGGVMELPWFILEYFIVLPIVVGISCIVFFIMYLMVKEIFGKDADWKDMDWKE